MEGVINRRRANSLTIYQAADSIIEFCLEKPKTEDKNSATRKLGRDIVARVHFSQAEGLEDPTDTWVSRLTLSTPNKPLYHKTALDIWLPYGVNQDTEPEDTGTAFHHQESVGVTINGPRVREDTSEMYVRDTLFTDGEAFDINTHTVADVDGCLESLGHRDRHLDRSIGFLLADAVVETFPKPETKPRVLLAILVPLG